MGGGGGDLAFFAFKVTHTYQRNLYITEKTAVLVNVYSMNTSDSI